MLIQEAKSLLNSVTPLSTLPEHFVAVIIGDFIVKVCAAKFLNFY